MKLKKVSCIVIIILLLTACFLCSCSHELSEEDIAKAMEYKGFEYLENHDPMMSFQFSRIYFNINVPRGYDVLLYASQKLTFEVRDNKPVHYAGDERETYYVSKEGTVMPQGCYYYCNMEQTYVLVCLVKGDDCYGIAIINITPYFGIGAAWNNPFIFEWIDLYSWHTDLNNEPQPISVALDFFDFFLSRQQLSEN